MLVFFNVQLRWLHLLSSDAREHTIAGEVIEFEQSEYGPRFLLSLRCLDGHELWPAPRIRLYLASRLSAVHTAQWLPGSRVQGRARLRPVHAVANAAGFNRERWLLGQGISASGTLQQVSELMLMADIGWRQRWIDAANPLLARLQQGTLLQALVFGEQRAIADSLWQAFRSGGIVHLIAISGMQIALAASMGWGLGRLLCLPWQNVVLHRWLPSAMALVLSGGYVLLSGASLPTQRAFWMVLIWLMLKQLAWRWSHWRIWWSTLALMLLGNGWNLFNSGFWLSFLAVALLLLATLWWRRPSLWRLQLWMFYGLLPLQIMLFGGQGLLALPVNLLAIPLFTLVLTPLGLLSGLLVPVFPTGAAYGFWLCDRLLTPAIEGLLWMTSHLDGWCELSGHQQQLLWLFWALPFCWWLPNARSLACCLLLAIAGLWCQPAPIWQVHVLDVGQGLSVLVQQGDRGLLYDVGDRFPGGFSLAESTVAPVLRYQGIRLLDYLVISHDDRDHAGNWQWIEQHWPVRMLISSAPIARWRRPCIAGQSQKWGALTLNWLWPIDFVSGKNNADSCVLRISDGVHTILLSGDLPALQEGMLVQQGLTPVTVLLSGHHGSASSSSLAWVLATRPRWVVHSSGFDNRWGFPKPAVIRRFADVGAYQFNTAEQGELSFSFEGHRMSARAWREAGPWYRRIDAWLGRE